MRTETRRAVQRHADHDAGLICRPVGNGLCEPLEGALSNLRTDLSRDTEKEADQ